MQSTRYWRSLKVLQSRSISACFDLLYFRQISKLLNQQYIIHITGFVCQIVDSFLKTFASSKKAWCSYIIRFQPYPIVLKNIFLYQKDKRNIDLSEKHCLLCCWKSSKNRKICITCPLRCYTSSLLCCLAVVRFLKLIRS